MNSTKKQWYLPSAGELYANMYGQRNNYKKIKNTWNKLGKAPHSYWFWSSSEDGNLAWEVYIPTGIVDWDTKTLNNAVTCFLPI